MELPLVYIVGVGRSGTSMLMTLLNGHSQIAFTPETHFLRYYLGTAEIQANIEQEGAAAFQQTLEADSYFQRLNLSAAELLQAYVAEDRDFDLVEIYEDILRQYLNRKGKQIIGDKDPRYLDYLDRIAATFPQAKIIHIYRDPRDVVLSKTKAGWSAHRPYWLNAMISQIQMEEGRKCGQVLFGTNYYELSYEELVTAPEETLSKLLAFLGLRFESEMLNLEQSARELVDSSEMQWKGNTFQPMLKENTQKWRKALSGDQIRVIESICEEWFAQLGYERADSAGTSWKEALLESLLTWRTPQRWLYNWQLQRQMKKGAN
ncbi:MAG: sulfotransferase [Bacteroidota bacterium]